jgi:DNA-binding GntR family transcriptional regulator
MANPLQRISAQLTQLAQQSSQALQAAKIPKAKIIINAPTHQELAIMINLSRETVTRAFQVLQAKGLVIREGNNLVIQQPEQMDDLASGKANPAKNSSSPGRGGSQDT